jgi:hypothetical protein
MPPLILAKNHAHTHSLFGKCTLRRNLAIIRESIM